MVARISQDVPGFATIASGTASRVMAVVREEKSVLSSPPPPPPPQERRVKAVRKIRNR
jgi:hypothetical protein